jgi:hypothetical protein
MQEGVHQWLSTRHLLRRLPSQGGSWGQLLCAIGTDGNDDIFPIAFAVAEVETRDSWEWFITIFLEDLCGPADRLGWVIMSDRQKVFMSQIKLINFVSLLNMLLSVLNLG